MDSSFAKRKRQKTKKDFSCDWAGCDYVTSRKWHLVEHMRTHTGEKPHACVFEGCGSKFAHSESLKRHMRTHTDEKPHACVFEGCESKFVTSGSLKEHMMTHTGEKPYLCDIEGCGYKCTTSGDLKRHMMRHTGEKPHACVFEGCESKFVQSGHLKAHMMTHTGEKPHACVFEGCGYKCTTSGDLKRHKYRMHGIGDGPTCAICKSRGVKFEGMSCIDCKLEHGTSNRGARERWVEQGLRGHEDVRLGNYSSHDKSLPCGGTSKKYRPDFLWIVSPTYAVVLEVDEDEHKTYDKECEAARIDNLYEGLARDEGIDYMHVVRFNPDQTRVSLTFLLERLCEVLDSQFDAECSWRQYVVEFHGYSDSPGGV